MKYLISVLFAITLIYPGYGADFLVSNNSSDHSLASDVNSLQNAINRAVAGDRVILVSNSVYIIKNRLTLKFGVQLIGKKGEAAFPLQQIAAFSTFPVSIEMVKMSGGSASYPGMLESLVVDGAGSACLILKSTDNRNNYVLKNCVFRNTRNNFTANPTNAAYWDVSVMIFSNAKNITIDSCDIRNAGLGETTGKINPYAWNGFGAGIKFYNCNNVIVKNATLNRMLTEGIRLSGTTKVRIENNTISRPGMNNEWADGKANQGLIIASGITGYHNQKAKNNNCDQAQNWEIINNRFFWCYNNAISLSGKGFTLSGNRVNYSIQHALFLGDWRNCSSTELNGRERVTRCTISNNDFENAFYNLSQWVWIFNKGLQAYQRPEPEFRKAMRINGIVNNDTTVVITSNNLHGQLPFYEFGFNDQGTTCVCPGLRSDNNTMPKAISKLTISPNPAHSLIYVKNDLKEKIEILNAAGILKLQTNQSSINISSLEKGLYCLHVGNASAWFIKE